MADEEVQLELGIDDRALRKGLRDIERDFSKFGSSVESSVKGASQSLEVFKGTFAGLAAFKALEIAGKAIGAAFGFVVDTMGRAITEAAGAEVAINNLNQALIRSGQFTPQLSKELEAFSDQLESTSTFTGEAAQSSLALLASLTRLDGEGLKSATQAAANLATVLGIDLDSATRLISKGANGNVEAFGRYGIEIRKGATDTETFSNLLQVLNSRFGGAAQGQLKSYSGSLTSLSNSYGKLLEQLGFIVTKNPAVIGLFNSTSIALQGLANSLSKQDFGKVISTSISVALESFALFVDGIDLVVKAFTLQVNVLSVQAQLIPAFLAKAFAAVAEFIASITSSIPILGGFAEKLADVSRIASEGISASLAEDVQDVKNVFTDTSALDSFAASIRQVSKDTQDFAAAASVAAPPAVDPNVVRGDGTSEADLATINARKTLNAELLSLENQRILEENLLAEQQRIAEVERFGVKTAEDIEALNSFVLTKNEIEYQAEVQKNEAIIDSEQEKLANKKALQTKEIADLRANAAAKRAVLAQEIADQQAFFSAAISLSNSENKTLAAIGKAAALGELAIKTPQAIASSFAFGTRTGGPVLGAVFAGVAATAMAAQAARIAGLKGFTDGGVVGGSNFSGDRIAINTNSDEMVLNREQQAELFNIAKGRGRSQDDTPIVIQIDGREVFRAMREYSQGGMRFA